jgi:superkiller protein 3
MTLFLAILALATTAQELSQQGAQAMREGRFADAERIYRRLVEVSPGESRWRLNLGLALHSAGKYKEAVPELERFLKTNPQPGPAHLVVGTARLKLGLYCEAIAPLEKVRRWQASAQTLIELGDAYNGCKRFLDAGRSYRDAARLQPHDVRLVRASARAFWQAREYQEARPMFAAIESRFSTDASFLYEYGDTLSRIAGAEEGLPYLERAARAAPDLLPARGALGRVLLELGRAADSVPHLEAAAPVDPALLLPLSRAYRVTDRVEEAARVEAEYRRKMAGQN